MAYCVEVSEDDYLYKSELPLDECSSLIIQSVDEYKLNQLEINPSDVSALFFFSFGLVLLSYKLSWVVGVLKSVIGKI